MPYKVMVGSVGGYYHGDILTDKEAETSFNDDDNIERLVNLGALLEITDDEYKAAQQPQGAPDADAVDGNASLQRTQTMFGGSAVSAGAEHGSADIPGTGSNEGDAGKTAVDDLIGKTASTKKPQSEATDKG